MTEALETDIHVCSAARNHTCDECHKPIAQGELEILAWKAADQQPHEGRRRHLSCSHGFFTNRFLSNTAEVSGYHDLDHHEKAKVTETLSKMGAIKVMPGGKLDKVGPVCGGPEHDCRHSRTPSCEEECTCCNNGNVRIWVDKQIKKLEQELAHFKTIKEALNATSAHSYPFCK